MNETTFKRSPEEVTEIERHKYFLSEKAGYDVGWQVAEQDWELNYAEQFRGSKNPESTSQAAGGIAAFLRRLIARAGL